MMCDLDFDFICYIDELLKTSTREFQEYMYLLLFALSKYSSSNQLFNFFLLENMVKNAPENGNGYFCSFVCMNPVSSWWCGLWSLHIVQGFTMRGFVQVRGKS